MKKHTRIAFLLLLISNIACASTMYTLSGVNKVYTVIEIMTKEVPQGYKTLVKEEITSLLNELDIQNKGYDERAFALLVSSIKVDKKSVIILKLIIGEPVYRKTSKEKTFALTYETQSHFIYEEGDNLEDKFEDALSSVLEKFSEQYIEENKPLQKFVINEKNFAQEMNYEVSYKEAVQKAKKMKKNIMLVLVANYCPWCRKFEQRVLLQEKINTLIHKNYIPLILNKEKDSFPKKYNKSFSPIVYFIDYKTLKSYKEVVGYNNKEEFMYIIHKDE
ncbi:thioredoxin family protein [Sulfurimonas sp. SAG-AH-194-I05]|nr:thioredoxin family protein [Sulfurimonas sp. SAG-AH-194-I05]MDF1874677.1 thioredoxin family protein [Sulfurimonas sp. SAG-AH-194-I05]